MHQFDDFLRQQHNFHTLLVHVDLANSIANIQTVDVPLVISPTSDWFFPPSRIIWNFRFYFSAKKQPLKTFNDIKGLFQQGKKREVKLLIRENAWPVNSTIRAQLWPELCAQHHHGKSMLDGFYWDMVNQVNDSFALKVFATICNPISLLIGFRHNRTARKANHAATVRRLHSLSAISSHQKGPSSGRPSCIRVGLLGTRYHLLTDSLSHHRHSPAFHVGWVTFWIYLRANSTRRSRNLTRSSQSFCPLTVVGNECKHRMTDGAWLLDASLCLVLTQ